MSVAELVPQLGAAFVLGLLTPLGAVCVLPLYPGFLAYLAGELSEKEQTRKYTILLFGLVISVGVVLFRFLPRARTRLTRSPWASAFLYGLFFGAIVIPCNPAFIAVLFTTTGVGAGFAANMARFIVFGVGIAFPLLVIAAVSSTRSEQMVDFLSRRKKTINRVTGGIMLGISLYYLIFVFRVFDRFIS